MKVKLGELEGCASRQPTPDQSRGFVGPLERFGDLDLPAKTSFRFADLMEIADRYLQRLQREQLKLFQKHGSHDLETDIYTLDTPEAVAAYRAEYAELVKVEIDLPGEKFRLSDFKTSSSPRPNDLRALHWLIDRGKPEVDDAELDRVFGSEPPAEGEVSFQHGGSLEDDPAKEIDRQPVDNVLDLPDRQKAAATA